MNLRTMAAIGGLALMVAACGHGGSRDGTIEPQAQHEPTEGVVFDSDIEWLGDSHTILPGFSTTVSDLFEPNRVRNYAIGATYMRVWDPGFRDSLYRSQRVGQTTTANCFILLGTADAGLPFPTNVPAYRAAMERLAFRWLLDGCDCVWIMTPPKVGAPHDPFVNQRLGEFREEILDFCQDPANIELGVSCGADLFELIDPAIHVNMIFLDHVHLNPLGNDVAADEIIRLLGL